MDKARNDIMQAMGDSFSHFKRAMQLYTYQNFGAQNLSPAQIGVLKTIYELQPVSHKALAQATHLTPGAVSQLVDALDEQHCVVRTANEADRRMSYLSISRSGKQLMDGYTKLRGRLLTNAFVAVPIEDLQVYIKVQQTVTDWLNAETSKKTKES